MNTFVRTKLIYTAIARPGAGKTETLLASLPALIGKGKRVVLALPTLVLADAIVERASKQNISLRTIDHRAGEPVAPELEAALIQKSVPLIICSQEAIRRVTHSLLGEWMLIVDELPAVVAYPDYPLSPLELTRVFDFAVEREGQLWIKEGLEGQVLDQVNTNSAAITGTKCSTLGSSAAHIFRMLLSRVDVFIDKPQADKIRHVRAVEEFHDWWNVLSSADEAHVLAANVVGSEFALLSEVNGFTFERSMFTPETGAYATPVTIFPLMPKGQIFSKSRMVEPYGDQRVIDFVLQKTLNHSQGKPLLLANKWSRLQNSGGAQFIEKDCRGLNNYDQSTEAILLFGGNPSPSEQKGLTYLKEKYNRDFKVAFITSRLLEPSLQAATRTAIRRSDNTDPVRLYVQDERVAEYLLMTYLPGAVVDWSLAQGLPERQDRRTIEDPRKRPVLELFDQGIKQAKKIFEITGVHRNTVSKWKKEWQSLQAA